MPFVILHHKLEDLPRWKAFFDELLPVRQSFGSREVVLMQNIADRNEIFITMEFPDFEKAQAYFQSPALHEAMTRQV